MGVHLDERRSHHRVQWQIKSRMDAYPILLHICGVPGMVLQYRWPILGDHSMTPLEAARTCIASLSTKEREKLCRELAMSVCDTTGHKYKKMNQTGWFSPEQYICEKCGRIKRVKSF